MSETPPHMTTLVGVAQRGWSGENVTSHISEFLFLSFFPFLQHLDKSHFLTDREYNYTPKQGCAFWGLDNIWPHLGSQTPKKLP